MGLTRVRLGQFIEEVTERNSDSLYGTSSVRGIVKDKEIRPTSKAKTDGDTIKKFLIVRPNEFVYNPRTDRMGGVIGIALNDTSDTLLFSFNNVAFRFTADGLDKIIPRWLLLYFKRTEFDRYVRFNSWGSATQLFTISDMFDVVIDLPPIEIQRKYVAIYESMLANQRAYESGLDDIKLACNALLDRCKLSSQRIRVGDCVSEVDRRNGDNRIDCAYGININKEFMPSKASSDDLRNYKLVFPGELAYSSMQTGRDKCIRIALHEGEDSIAVSPAYSILHMKESSALSAEYLMTWFSRPESDRLGWFLSDASIRANLDLDRFLDIEIPVPEFNVQVAITSIYKALRARTAINKRLKTQLREICPILIRGSIEEALKQP
jgi:type I restriction enzyme S subunit